MSGGCSAKWPPPHHEESVPYADTDALLALALELDERTDRLRAVWKAVEWCVSSDWGPDDVLQAINAYEAAGDTKGQQP